MENYDFSHLSREELIQAIKIQKEINTRSKFNLLPTYKPYPKQKKFHDLGTKPLSERLLCAGNQLGKTVSGGAEWAYHLTGRYPDWWEGAEFKKPVVMWASGVTNESTRDNPQRVLIGDPAQENSWGSGWIPRECLEETPRGSLRVNKSMGVKNALDSAVIKWGGGGDLGAQYSSLYFKSYERGREKWQGPTLDGVWFDEEPPLEIYSEGRTRTQNGRRGIFTIITFTPLLGMSEVVRMFWDLRDEEDEKIPSSPAKEQAKIQKSEEISEEEEQEAFSVEFDGGYY